LNQPELLENLALLKQGLNGANKTKGRLKRPGNSAELMRRPVLKKLVKEELPKKVMLI
jgi:hypothetical protein